MYSFKYIYIFIYSFIHLFYSLFFLRNEPHPQQKTTTTKHTNTSEREQKYKK